MATITLFANKINDLPELVRNARSSVDTFKEDLSSLITSALKVDGDVCSLEDTISSLRSSTDTQEDKIDALENIADDIEDFIDEVVSVDEDAADAITQSKDDFYDEYPYLKPDCEKSGWEQFLDDLKDIGEWCKEHWEDIKVVLLVLECIVAIVLICIPGTQALGMAIGVGIIKGFLSGALMGGLAAWAGGGSFSDILQGAFSGAVTGGLLGGVFGAVGFAGSALGATHSICKIAGLVQTVAKTSGMISLGMMGFDMAAMGAQGLTRLGFGNSLFDAVINFNKTCHSSKLYNSAQLVIGLTAVFTGSLYKSAEAHGNTCFVAGTLVATVNGLVAIENIKAGDKVIATDPETMKVAAKTVVETYVRTDPKLYHIVISGEEFITTETHPFYVQQKGFVKAGELNVGDKLLDINGKTLVIEEITIEITEEPTTVYNFQVEDFHTYHVGENGVLVHNARNYSPDKMQKIQERQRLGHEFERQKHEELAAENPTAQSQVRVKPLDSNGNPMRRGGNYLDDLFVNEDGVLEINEYKLGQNSPYQRNQIANGFADGVTNKDLMIVSGEDAGTIIPEGTTVNTIRSE